MQNSSATVVPEHASLSLLGQEAHSVIPSPRRVRRGAAAASDNDDESNCDESRIHPANNIRSLFVIIGKQVLTRLRLRALFGTRCGGERSLFHYDKYSIPGTSVLFIVQCSYCVVTMAER